MKRHTLFCWLCMLFALWLSAGAVFGAEKPVSPGKNPIVLFNGKDLSNFDTWLQDTKHEDPRQVFSVTKDNDGTPVLRLSGDGFGGLITKRAYSNYHLVVEYRWGDLTWGGRKDKTKDSGIMLHCTGPAGSASKDQSSPWMASIECQIIEGGVGDFIIVAGYDKSGKRIATELTSEVTKDRDGETVWKKGGEKKRFPGGRINWYGRDPDWKDVLGFRGKEDVESPGQEWTRVECICRGGRITNIVNGKVVNRGTLAKPRAGKLLFQTEGAEILFRKIELRPLKKKKK